MNLSDIKRRVIELVPGLIDVSIKLTDAWVGLRTDEVIAQEIAKGLRA